MATLLKISESELLDALAAAAVGSSPEEAKTAGELAEAFGLSHPAARKALAVLKKQGRLQVHTVSREGIDGRLSRIAGYTIAPKRKA